MGKILLLAVAAAFYPTLVAIAILILARPKPVRLFAGFLIGGMTVSIGVGLAILAFADTSAIGSGSSGSTRPILSLILGIMLVALALALQAGRDLPMAERRAARRAARKEKAAAKAAGKAEEGPKESWPVRLLTRDSIWLAIGLGAVLNLPSVWYLSALREIDIRDYSDLSAVMIVLAFNLIMFSLIEIPLAACLFAPDRAADAVKRFDRWTRSHMRQIGIVVAAVGGLYLVVDGLIGLL